MKITVGSVAAIVLLALSTVLSLFMACVEADVYIVNGNTNFVGFFKIAKWLKELGSYSDDAKILATLLYIFTLVFVAALVLFTVLAILSWLRNKKSGTVLAVVTAVVNVVKMVYVLFIVYLVNESVTNGRYAVMKGKGFALVLPILLIIIAIVLKKVLDKGSAPKQKQPPVQGYGYGGQYPGRK